MADLGARVSRRGYDVATCSDRQVLWSSSFQSLKVVGVLDTTFNIPSGSTTLMTHNLGYVPFFWVQFPWLFSMENICVNSTEVKWDTTRVPLTPSYHVGDSVTVRMMLFNPQITTTFTSPTINTTDEVAGGYGDYGIKASIAGKDISSTNPLDLVFSSGSTGTGQAIQMPIVQKFGYVSGHDGSVQTVSHGLTYPPMFVAYVENGGYWNQIFPDFVVGPSQFADAYCDSSNIYYYNSYFSGNNNYAYFILKDPSNT
jgi:hypothetical protein